jgi:type II secretory pathway component PulF
MTKKNHHIILHWRGHDIQWQGQEVLMSSYNNNSWNMMSTMVRVGMLNKLRQNEAKTTIKQVMLYPCMVFRVTMVDDEWSGDC